MPEFKDDDVQVYLTLFDPYADLLAINPNDPYVIESILKNQEALVYFASKSTEIQIVKTIAEKQKWWNERR